MKDKNFPNIIKQTLGLKKMDLFGNESESKYTTQMLMAKKKELTSEMETILKTEIISPDALISKVASGNIVIIPNSNRSRAIAIGDGVRSKILCNLGTSTDSTDISRVVYIAQEAEKFGASIICDQSTDPNLSENRKKLLKSTTLPLASIPLYQNAEDSINLYGNPISFTEQDVIKIFRKQLEQGITAPGIHPITVKLVQKIDNSKRIMPYVSRGGAILANWMKKTNKENPYIKNYSTILNICAEYDVPLTFVCATRSGCLADGLDDVQKYEWKIIGKLVKIAHKKNVGVIIDGVGHLRIDKIPIAIKTLKRMTHHVPVGVMGPATTDRALGHEHIAHAIGATIAIQYGANYCQNCCRTEHLGLPESKDVVESIGTYRIATYAADLTKLSFLQKFDDQISLARSKNQWGKQLELAIEPHIARETFERVGPKDQNKKGCSICGDLCPFKVQELNSEGK